jgi:hypothetical protein
MQARGHVVLGCSGAQGIAWRLLPSSSSSSNFSTSQLALVLAVSHPGRALPHCLWQQALTAKQQQQLSAMCVLTVDHPVDALLHYLRHNRLSPPTLPLLLRHQPLTAKHQTQYRIVCLNRLLPPSLPQFLCHQALTTKQQQLSVEASSLEQQLSAAASMRLELVQLRADLLDRLGTFYGDLQQQQRQLELEAINNTTAEVRWCVVFTCMTMCEASRTVAVPVLHLEMSK